MEKKIATLISWLLHPLWMPFITFVLLLWTDPAIQGLLPLTSRLVLAGIFFFVTIFLPLVFTAILYKTEIISSFYMEKQEERIYPLLVTGVFYYLAFYLLKGIKISPAISLFMLGSTIILAVVLILTFSRKVSFHTSAMGGLTGLLLGFPDHFGGMPYLLYAVILLAGITGTARLMLNAHKSSDIYIGFLVGVVVMFVVSLFG
jgi:hypothetical protein